MEQRARPKVTVIVPNYNHAKFLPERLNSVFNQTYTNLEVILMDDCSSDISREILQEYASRDSRAKLVFNEKNSGSTFKQWNKGIGLATGEYVWIAESDDAADLQLVEVLIGQLEKNPDAGLAYCQSWLMDDSGKKTLAQNIYEEYGHTNFCAAGKSIVEKYMAANNVIPNASAVLMRKAVLLQVGPAPEHMRLAGDWLFWVRYLMQTSICFVNQPLNFFRYHTNNVRSSSLRGGLNLVEMARVLGYVKQAVNLDPVVYQQALSTITERWFHTFIYSPLTYEGHKAFIKEMKLFEPGFSKIFSSNVLHLLRRNKLSGLKMLIFDKLLGKA